MSAVERYLEELAGAVRVRGRARRRFLRECEEHLHDAAARHGSETAVQRFGDAHEIAAAFDTEVSAGRARRATAATVLAVVAVAASTLHLIHSAAPGASAVRAWAIVFFASAQTTAVCVLLGALQALALAHRAASPCEVVLLCRRNLWGLGFAGLTFFAAGAALPGSSAPLPLLAGPSAACVAAGLVLRARAGARRLDTEHRPLYRSPLGDLRVLLRTALPDVAPVRLLAPTAVGAAAAAFCWDRGEQAPAGAAVTVACLEAGLVVAGFVLLGRALGVANRGRAT